MLLTKYDKALENCNNVDYGSWKFSTARSCLVIRGMADYVWAVDRSGSRGIVDGSVVE